MSWALSVVERTDGPIMLKVGAELAPPRRQA